MSGKPNTGGVANQAAGSKVAVTDVGGGSGGGGKPDIVDPIGTGATEGVTRGKYYLVEVPNWNDSADDPMSSYIRLGAVKDVTIAGQADAPKHTGEDLAAYVKGFIDDTRDRGVEGEYTCARDDEFTFTPVEERLAESAILHTKGGWRDHSDGNRITTTRGDKVEVIRGNYKMVVLGRTDREDDAVVTDLSGGHGATSPITFRPGYQNKIEWVKNYDGTWKVTESTVRGDVHSTYHGDTVDFYYGNKKESTTGSAAPSKFHENPAIVDRTWAVSMESYTGVGLPVPSITDVTEAGTMDSTTNAGSISSTTVVGTITDTTTAGTMTSTTTAGTITDTTTAAAIISNTVGNTINNQVGNDVTTTIGATSEITLGSTSEVTIGGESSITVGTVLDIQVAAFLNLALSGGVDISVGPQLSIGVFQVSWNPLCHDIKSMKSTLASVENRIASQFSQLAAVMFLG